MLTDMPKGLVCPCLFGPKSVHLPAFPVQTVESIDYAHRGPVTRDGQTAVCAIKCVVYGDEHITNNVLELVAFNSMTKVHRVCRKTIPVAI